MASFADIGSASKRDNRFRAIRLKASSSSYVLLVRRGGMKGPMV